MKNSIWEICACLQNVDGTLLDKKSPFQTYYVEASSSKESIDNLEKMLPGYSIAVYGKPRLSRELSN